MVAELVHQPHPITACAQTISESLAEVADLQPAYLRPDDKRAALLALDEAQRRMDELRLRLIAASSDVAEDDGARDIAAWLAHRTHAEPAPLRAEQKLAEALDTKWSRVQAGMAAGIVSVDQATVIVRGLEALPDRVGAEVIAKAEAHLVELAKEHTPSELRRLARHILDVVAPEIAEAEEAKRLEEEEQQAREATRITSRSVGNGMVRGTIVASEADWARFQTSLESFTSPRKTEGALGGEEDRIPHSHKLGQAFCALLEHLDPTKLPHHGGDATSVMVTISLEGLMADLATAGLIDGDLSAGPNLSASEARRLACTAQILPVVLGGEGEILDLGRARRLFSPAQRKAMRLRDKRCRAEGCSIPATWTEAHHLKPWSEGGKTDLADGVLLCAWHHHRIHDRRFDHELLPSGDIRFFRRG